MRFEKNRELHKAVSVGCLLVANAMGINSCTGSIVSLLSSSLAALEMKTFSSGLEFSKGSLRDKGACHMTLKQYAVILIIDKSFLIPEVVFASIAL